jgi:hypothetical protein
VSALAANPGSLRLGWVESLTLERLATTTAAAALASLPLIKPSAAANLGPVDPLIIMAISAVLLWAGSENAILRAPYAVSMGLFLLAGALGALNGPVPGEGSVALVQDIVLVAWCLAIANLGTRSQRLATLMRAWAGSSILWALVLVGSVLTGNAAIAGQTAQTGARASLTFGDPNVAATYFVIGLMLVWAAGWPRNLLLRWAGYGTLLLAILLTGSNGGVVMTAAAITVASLPAITRRAGALAAIAAFSGMILGAVVVYFVVDFSSVQQQAQASRFPIVRDGIGRSSSSAGDRGVLFDETFSLYKEGGVLGRGPGSTKQVLADQQAHRIKEAHNDYTASLVERGALGALALLFLLGSILVRTTSVAFRKASPGLSRAIHQPGALAGAVVGCLIAGMFYEVLHFRHVWGLLGIVAAAYFSDRS